MNLYLDGNPLCLEGAVALIRMLSSEHFQAYRLDLRGCRLTTVGGSIIPTVSTSPNISEPITCVGIREWICSNGIKANNIKELDLGENSFTGDGIHLLAGFIYLCPQLLKFHCFECEITFDDLRQLLSQLSVFHCDEYKITSDDLKLFLTLLSQPNLSLKYRNLSNSNIDDDRRSALFEQFPMFPVLIGICSGNSLISQERYTNLEICEKRKKVSHLL